MDQFYFLTIWLTVGLTFAFSLCFFFLSIEDSKPLSTYRNNRYALAVAYLGICVGYVFVYLMDSKVKDIFLINSLTLVIGTILGFVITFSLIALIDSRFVTRRMFLMESLPILFLITSTVIVLIHGNKKFIQLNFWIFFVYYLSLLFRYSWLFFKKYQLYVKRMDNYFSEKEAASLRWVKFAFIFALIVGYTALFISLKDSYEFAAACRLFYCWFYAYFAIKFLNYPIHYQMVGAAMENEVAEVSFSNEKTSSIPFEQLEGVINKWIENRCFTASGITIEQVASALGTNRTYLSNYVNSYLGKTFKEWISELRIKEAQILLLSQEEATVGEIGILVGFTDKGNFSRHFSKYSGKAPKAWRKEKQETKP